MELASAVIEGGRRGRAPLTVLYDERCPLCRRLKTWLAGQATLVPIEFLPAACAEAVHRYPRLDHSRTATVLTVVAANGAVFEGERAWLACAWALPGWQPVAERLGTRTGLPLVRIFSRTVDWYRHRLIVRSYGTSCDTCRVTAPPGAAAPRRAGRA
jgi:predicted DCC family thiol-disulfide oxidoreductase YuxK